VLPDQRSNATSRVLRAVAVFLGQARGQARGAHRVVGRQAHAQVADHGQHLHGIFDADGFEGLHGHNVTANQ
jgi:hypothetical protein